jgi:hypothetical protein
VGDDKLAGGVEGVGEEVDGGAVEAGVGRAEGVGVPRAKVVERQLGMGEEEVPEVGGEVDVNGSEEGDEVVFEDADGAFSGVGTVVVGGNVLDFGGDGGGLEELGEEGGVFIVGDDMGDGVAVEGEEGDGPGEGLHVGARRPGGLRLHVDVPPVRGNEYVLVTTTGGDREAPGQVRSQPLLARDGADPRLVGVMGILGGGHLTR